MDSLSSRLRDLTRAVTSGRCDLAIYRIRHTSCFGDDKQAPCPDLVPEGGHHYCGSCGCPRWPGAALDGKVAKLWWKHLTCPRQRPGFVNSNAPPGKYS